MSHSSEAPFKLFRVSAGPFTLPAYAICTAFRNDGGYLKSECFVLIQRSPNEGVAFGTRFSYSDDTGGTSPIVMDEAFAMDDAQQQAETMYSVRAQELDPNLLEKLGWARPTLQEIPQHRLVAVWAHTPLAQALLDVADNSNCTALREFIRSLRGLPTVKQTPLVL